MNRGGTAGKDPAVAASEGGSLELPTERFVRACSAAAGGEDLGVYLAGSPALGDLSPRQSNIDIVVVTAAMLPADSLGSLRGTHGTLQLNGRDPVVCYTTWRSLEGSPDEAEAAVFVGRRPAERDRLANPMTWAVLAGHPHALRGPERPHVRSDGRAVREWFTGQLPGTVERTSRLLWRRHLTRLVLQSVRCAHGALTGEVLSLRRAGELAMEGATHTGQRVIADALGYREGANTSMYWGPFERKSNAVTLVRDLLREVNARSGTDGA